MPSWLLHSAIIFFIIVLLSALALWGWHINYENKIFPGVTVGNYNLGGKTSTEAEKILAEQRDTLEQNGIIFDYKGKTKTILPTVASADAELAYNMVELETTDTADQALAFGRDRNLFTNLFNQLNAFIFSQSIKPVFNFDEAAFKKALVKNFSDLETPAQNAQLVFSPSAPQGNAFTINPEKSGEQINYDQAIIALKNKLDRLDFSPINLSSSLAQPQILAANVLNAEVAANQYLNLAPLVLTSGSSTWPIEKNQLGSWLGLETTSSTVTMTEPYIGLNRNTIAKYLTETIAPKTNIKPEEARFQVTNGRVGEFKTAKDGQELDIASTTSQIETAFIKNKQQIVAMVINKIVNQSSASSTDNLGITEIIGTGHSVFTGSSKSRRTNIAVGANTLSGLLIKPGQTFSVMQALGKIDASSGYLQELVIKGNKTLPEYGGGLCQVGTTMFRAALQSGLPINERRNHSYRVAYYEPAGTDATIYDPSPDLKFTNDTNNYILIQSRMSGNNLYFDFWGTRDGRVASSTYPTIYNIVKPKPGKIIETTDLPAGQKKCTEKAHNGADAFFNYTVTYTNGTTKEKKFTSHYTPWQEVCLLGVKKLSTSTASSTLNTSIKQASSTKTSNTSSTNPVN